MQIDRNDIQDVQYNLNIMIKQIQVELRYKLKYSREPEAWVWRDDAYWHRKEHFWLIFNLLQDAWH